jgi:hypothetical protein
VVDLVNERKWSRRDSNPSALRIYKGFSAVNRFIGAGRNKMEATEGNVVFTKRTVVAGVPVMLFSRDGDLFCTSLDEFDRTQAARAERLQGLLHSEWARTNPILFGFRPRAEEFLS